VATQPNKPAYFAAICHHRLEKEGLAGLNKKRGRRGAGWGHIRERPIALLRPSSIGFLGFKLMHLFNVLEEGGASLIIRTLGM